MNIEVILCFSLILILCGVLVMCYFDIRKSLRKIKECNDGMTRCTENYYKNPNDNNWIYMKQAWKNLRIEHVLTICVISVTIIISLSAMVYIGYILNSF